EKLRRRGGVPDSQKIAGEFFEITKQIEKLQSKLLESGTLEASAVGVAVQTIEGLKQALTSAFEFYNGYDPLFTWWIPLPYSGLDKALTDYAETFKEKQPLPGKHGIVAGIPAGK